MRKYKRVDLVYRKEACGLLALPDLRGQETRLEFQVSLEEPELHPMGKGHLGKARRSCYPGLDRDRTQLAQGQGAAWKKDGGFTSPQPRKELGGYYTLVSGSHSTTWLRACLKVVTETNFPPCIPFRGPSPLYTYPGTQYSLQAAQSLPSPELLTAAQPQA